MSDKEIKKMSRSLNKGTHFSSFCIVLYSAAAAAVFCILPYLLVYSAKKSGLKALAMSAGFPVYPVIISVLLGLVSLAALINYSAVSLGEKAWYGGRLTKKRQCGKRLRYWFIPSHSFKAFRLKVLLFLLKGMWSVVFLSPAMLAGAAIIGLAMSGGIELYLFLSLAAGGFVTGTAGLIFRFVTVQKYFLAPYLLADDPRLKPIQVIKQSKNILDGRILRIARFKIKFIPWFLTYPLIVPVIFLHPYYKQSCSVLAKEICL